MKILFIAPLPPPITGQSIAAEILYHHLREAHQVNLVNLSKDSLTHGVGSVGRIVQVLGIFRAVWMGRSSADVIYFTISESIAGNIKDLAIYLICLNRLGKMVIHLHGGSIRKVIFDRNRLLRLLNRFFVRRLGGVIVLGTSHVGIFADMIAPHQVHIVANGAQDHVFIQDAGMSEKYRQTTPLRVLFLSNLIERKGHHELVDAFMALHESAKEKVRLDFAGAFESDAERQRFLARIRGHKAIRYHGTVDGKEKRQLLCEAHVLCLPTRLYEGQPMSILEAYAAGCVVVTTRQDGIADVFEHGVNGLAVEGGSADSIGSAIEDLLRSPERLQAMGAANREAATARYTTATYNASLQRILGSIADCAQASRR